MKTKEEWHGAYLIQKEQEQSNDYLQKENDKLRVQVKSLERKLALAHRSAEHRALAEREKFMVAISPEVDTIRQRILARIP